MNKSISLTTRDIVRISIFTALIVIGAFISIPIGPVPITLQSFFVFVSVIFLDKKAVYSVLVYFFLGIIGIPIFADGISGAIKIFTPSFGFLLGMILASYVLGRIIVRFKNLSFSKVFCVFIFGNFIIYFIGLPYMVFILNIYLNKGIYFNQILTSGMLLFLPGDILKSFLAAIIYRRTISFNKNFKQ